MSQPANPTQTPTPEQPTEETKSPALPEKPVSNIQGEVLPLDDLLNFAIIDPGDLEAAAQWFDEHATPTWTGALDGVTGDAGL
jgi:hypothetical protein